MTRVEAPMGPWGRAGLLAVAMALLGWLSTAFVFPPYTSAALWPPAGMAVAALARSPVRQWPALLLAVAVGGALIPAPGLPLEVILLLALGGCLRTLVGAALLRWWVGPGAAFTEARAVVGLVLAGGMSPVVSAVVATAAVTRWHVPVPNPFVEWLSWYMSDALGILLVAPLLLTWRTSGTSHLTRRQVVETGAALLVLAGLAALIFSRGPSVSLYPTAPYVCFPFVLWAAFRAGPRGAVAAMVVLGALAIWNTAAGRGPFGLVFQSPGRRLLSVQAYVVLLGLPALLLGAASRERERAMHIQRLLARAGETLAQSLDYHVTFPRLASLAVPAVAHGLGVWRWEDGQAAEPLARAGLGREAEEAFLACARERMGATSLCPEAGGCSLVVPLSGRTGALGVLGLMLSDQPRAPTPDERTLAEDLARRCTLALEAAQLYSRAQEAIVVRDEFLTVAAHELRTPLTSAKLRLQSLMRLLRGSPSAEAAAAPLHRLEHALGRLSQQVENLLDVGRLNTGTLQLHREVVDVAALADEEVAHLAEDAVRAGCTLERQGLAHLTGWLDRRRLAQALRHLLSNALKFGAGSPVTVSVLDMGGDAVLAVRDRGIGIPPEALDRIFDRFERAVSTDEYGGMGLGLFLTRHIVEAHGGTLSVTSEPGQGTTVTLRLPLGARAAADASTHP